MSLPVKEFRKSVNIWGSYEQEFSVLFFETQCTYMHTCIHTHMHTCIHAYIQTLDNAHNSEAKQSLNLRRGRSPGGSRTVDINDEQTDGFLDEI